jgi:hypothetical protein
VPPAVPHELSAAARCAASKALAPSWDRWSTPSACDRPESGAMLRRPPPVLPLSGRGTRPRTARLFAPSCSLRRTQVAYAIALPGTGRGDRAGAPLGGRRGGRQCGPTTRSCGEPSKPPQATRKNEPAAPSPSHLHAPDPLNQESAPLRHLFVWYRSPISTIRRATFVVASPGLVRADLPCLKPARLASPSGVRAPRFRS